MYTTKTLSFCVLFITVATKTTTFSTHRYTFAITMIAKPVDNTFSFEYDVVWWCFVRGRIIAIIAFVVDIIIIVVIIVIRCTIRITGCIK